MIAHEHIRWISFRDLILTLFISGFVSLLVYLFSSILSPFALFLSSIFLFIAGVNFLLYITKKTGIATLFFLTVSLLTFTVTDIGAVGWKKVLTFVIVGIIFEITYLVIKFEVHNLSADVIVSSVIVGLFLPLITAFLISPSLASDFPLGLINFFLSGIGIALLSSVLTALLWMRLKRKKNILHLEAFLQDLR